MPICGRDHVVEHHHDDDEQHGGEWVALPKTMHVVNFPAWPPIHHNSRSGRREEYGDPFGPPRRKADEREELDEEFLRDRIECLGDIDLHEDGRAATAIKPATGELNCHEVVVNGSSSNEGTLVVLDQGR